MIFPEHMEFRYYITPERKECFTLYSKIRISMTPIAFFPRFKRW